MTATLPDRLRRLGGSPRRFAPQQHLFHRSHAVKVIHLVEDGEVHLRRHQPGGAALVVQRARRDDVFAEASLFAAAYHCDDAALVPTLTLAIAKPQLRAAMTQDPDLAR
ncbi:MAG: cyclic nucleotide-binding domain-containing protein [Alphaproteobacteria bacterium]